MHFSPASELRWLFCDLNSYFASVEQNEDPNLRGRPVAVVPALTDSTCAIAASYEAKAYGIKTGTKIYEAKKLCPHLICVLARHDLYVDYHHRIFEVVENHIHVSKVCSIDEVSCELMGRERHARRAIALAENMKNELSEKIGPSITCSIGLAPNAFLAKIASNLKKPNGLVVMKPGQYQQRLFALKLTDLPGINVAMNARLNRAGIQTVEDFWKLSPKHARLVWGGVGGERFWYKLHGFEVPDLHSQKRVIGHSRVLDPAHRGLENAFLIASQLTMKAAGRLRRAGLYARRFSLHCKTVENKRWETQQTFSPAQDNFTFLGVLKTMWRDMSRALGPVRLKKVSITLTDLLVTHDVTLDLFDVALCHRQRFKNEELSQSIDALNTRFGAGTISIGWTPKTSAGHVGTKIAFNRVPAREEFDL